MARCPPLGVSLVTKDCAHAALWQAKGTTAVDSLVILPRRGCGPECVLTLRPAHEIALLHESRLSTALSVCIFPSKKQRAEKNYEYSDFPVQILSQQEDVVCMCPGTVGPHPFPPARAPGRPDAEPWIFRAPLSVAGPLSVVARPGNARLSASDGETRLSACHPQGWEVTPCKEEESLGAIITIIITAAIFFEHVRVP